MNVSGENEEDVIYYYPYATCISCETVTKNWGFVQNAMDYEIYCCCPDCTDFLKTYGINVTRKK